MKGRTSLLFLLSDGLTLLPPEQFLSPCGVCTLEAIFVNCINIKTKHAITLSFGPAVVLCGLAVFRLLSWKPAHSFLRFFLTSL